MNAEIEKILQEKDKLINNLMELGDTLIAKLRAMETRNAQLEKLLKEYQNKAEFDLTLYDETLDRINN